MRERHTLIAHHQTHTAFSPPAHAAAAAAAPSPERSFIMIKPDGVQRGLIADVVGRFESKGYKLVAAKVIIPTQALAAAHYAEHEGKPFFPKLVAFLTSGPVVAMVWEGQGVIAGGRALIGATNPAASPPGTIRGDLAVDTGRNVVHGSDSPASAAREAGLWFAGEGEVVSWARASEGWVYE